MAGGPGALAPSGMARVISVGHHLRRRVEIIAAARVDQVVSAALAAAGAVSAVPAEAVSADEVASAVPAGAVAAAAVALAVANAKKTPNSRSVLGSWVFF